MASWDTIHTNFKTVMESSISGYVSGSYVESSAVDLKKKSSEPYSIFDRAYSIQMESMDSTSEYINGVADFNYNVVLQVGRELSYNDNKSLYNNAVEEIATIIQKRLNPLSYQGTLLNVTHTGTSGFDSIGNTDNENFSVTEISFKVQYRVSI